METDNRPEFILLIDDDADDRLLFKEAFDINNPGIELVMLSSGVHALQYLNTGGNIPSLIILDYNMPAMNGFDVIARIGKSTHLADIPTVILSTAGIATDDYTQLGAKAGFVKPLTFRALVLIVAGILQYRKT